jgi:hypothetical protein
MPGFARAVASAACSDLRDDTMMETVNHADARMHRDRALCDNTRDMEMRRN